jgi:hypothetical protein
MIFASELMPPNPRGGRGDMAFRHEHRGGCWASIDGSARWTDPSRAQEIIWTPALGKNKESD